MPLPNHPLPSTTATPIARRLGPRLAHRRALPRVVAAAVALTSLLALSAPAQADKTTYKARYTCADRGVVKPLAGITVQLWRRGTDWLPVEWVGSIDDRGYTDAKGKIELRSTKPIDQHFLRMALRSGKGVRLKDFFGINDWSVDSDSRANDRATRNYAIAFETPGWAHKCAVWQGVRNAYADYIDVTHKELPSKGVLIQADAITAGKPFTPYQEIWWPSNFAPSEVAGEDYVTRHEFGHVVRHSLDGDLGHFLGDAVAFQYPQFHSRCQKTNAGFAFNEGWADYWARRNGTTPCSAFAVDDYAVEGNVTAALSALAATCYADDRARMIAILRSHPGTIHSFPEFRAYSACKTQPKSVHARVAPPAPAPADAPEDGSISESELATVASARVATVDAALVQLRAKLKRAQHDASNARICKPAPCAAALRRAAAPAAVRTEIALAELERGALADRDTVPEVRVLRGVDPDAAMRRTHAMQKRNRIAAAKILADGIDAALAAGRSSIARDHSRTMRGLVSLLTSRKATFRKVQRTGVEVPGLILHQSIADRTP